MAAKCTQCWPNAVCRGWRSLAEAEVPQAAALLHLTLHRFLHHLLLCCQARVAQLTAMLQRNKSNNGLAPQIEANLAAVLPAGGACNTYTAQTLMPFPALFIAVLPGARCAAQCDAAAQQGQQRPGPAD